MEATSKRVLVALDAPANAEALVIETNAVFDRDDEPSLVAPAVSRLAEVLGAAEALHDAQTNALKRRKDLRDERNAATPHPSTCRSS